MFTPLVEFFAEETRSHYVPGLTYRARPHNKTLRALLPQWEAAGKIRIIGQNPAAAQLKGH